MPRYELTGSAIGSAEAISRKEMHRILREAGARYIREAYHYGWRNQPRTLRFSALDDAAAEAMGDAVDRANNPTGALGGGGLIRAYGLHWKTS